MGGGEDRAGSGLNWVTVPEWPAVMELQQQHGSGRCRLGERAGEGRGKERERVERAGELGSALKHGKMATRREQGRMAATRAAAPVGHCSSFSKF